MNFIDNFKLRTIIEESITSLKFLDSVKPQDDISSQLAGFEISKLLKNQNTNEKKYQELVLRRANLTQITQKQQLQVVEAQIASLSWILKESTKKLCKLFKQNPDLQADSLKVTRQRNTLILKLKQLIEFVKNNSTNKFMSFITNELQSQDQMHRCLEKQKNLKIQIKKLQQDKAAESREYQKQISENQARIKQFKETLMQKMETNKIELDYKQKQAKAELQNQRRTLHQAEKALKKDLQNLKTSVGTERLVHKEMEEYLKSKTEEIKNKISDLATKQEQANQQFENYMLKIDEELKNTQEELEEFKQKYKQEQQKKIARQKQERDKLLQKKRREQMQIRKDNAIKYIQNSYLAWKEAGGGKKKKKR